MPSRRSRNREQTIPMAMLPPRPRMVRNILRYSLVRVAALVGMSPTTVRIYELDSLAVFDESRRRLNAFYDEAWRAYEAAQRAAPNGHTQHP